MTTPRKDSYSTEEINLLKEIFENNPKKYIIERFQQAGHKRSIQSIFNTATKKLGLKRNPEIVKQDRVDGGKKAPIKDCWAKNEEEILNLNYIYKPQEEIMSLLPGRTWRAIRGHALSLGLTRSKEIVNSDRAKHLKEHLGVTSTWQLESVKSQSRKTNIERRGVEYPSQSADVREKVRETVQERYGVDNVFQSEEIKTKLTQTNIEKYGVPNPLQNKKIQDKVKTTNMEKYGIENTFQLTDRVQQGMIRNHGDSCPLRVPEIKERQQQTNIEKFGFKTPAENSEIQERIEATNMVRYGVKTPFQNEEVQQKIVRTNIERYGVDNPLKSEEIQNKARQTLYEHGTQKCSKQQHHIASILNKIEKINYPIGNCNADILIESDIICEYDGGGHEISMKVKNGLTQEEFLNAERRRDLFLKSKGFSIIRIISKEDLLPKNEIILKIISKAKEYLKSGHSWITFDIDHKKVICSQFQKQYDFGILHKI